MEADWKGRLGFRLGFKMCSGGPSKEGSVEKGFCAYSHLLKSFLGTAWEYLCYTQQLKVSPFMLMEDFQKGLPTSDSGSSELSIDKWSIVEQTVREILWAVQPNVASEWKRRGLIDYIQRVIKGSFGTEVLSFGSVPLKTYIPNGDIDLTVLCPHNREDDLARDICSLLQAEQKEPGFLVEEVRYIYAKVKIIKCTVNNIAIDISFNQMAGLCTLCFLEQVDQFVGRDHLFKKSIILIKAWCYYESRILGAASGLISTYALDTLILWIINLFHSSLHGPSQVLHKFLEYYSKFDWQNYCVSINGPVSLSLSSILKIRETTETEMENLLLTKEFVKKCRVAFSIRRKMNEGRLQEFPVKYFNIVDPLKDDNNLGRNIPSGNLMRIKSAFALGREQLDEVLALPVESIGQELRKKLFMAIVRNGKEQRPDLQTPVSAFDSGRSVPSNLNGDYDFFFGGMLYAQAFHDQSLHLSLQPCPQPCPPPSQVENYTTWNARTWSMEQHNWNVLDRIPVNAYALPFYNCAPQQTADWRTFRGTGTYIPDANLRYRQLYSKMRGRPEPRTDRVMMKPTQKGKQAEMLSGTNTGVHVSSFGRSVGEISHLAGIQVPPPSPINPSGKPSASIQSQIPPHTIEDCKLGVLGPAPLPLRMHPLETRADSGGSHTRDSRSRVCEIRMPSQQVRLSIDESKKEHFQLDDKDFPPLGSKTAKTNI